MLRLPLPGAWGYGVAVLAVVLATVAQSLLDPLVGPPHLFAPFYLAVIVAAWAGGTGPAILALALGALSAFAFIPYPTTGWISIPVGLALYVLVGTAVILLGEARHRGRRQSDGGASESEGEQSEESRAPGRSHRGGGREGTVAERRDFAEDIIDTVRDPLLVLDADLRVASASRSFYRAFQTTPEQAEGRTLYELGNGQWDIPDLRRLLDEILPENNSFDDFEVEHDFPDIGPRSMRLNARKVYREANHTELILLAIEDITDLKREQQRRQEAEVNFTSLVENIEDHAIFTLDPDGRISSWNVAAREILGYTEEEALGQPFFVVFTEEDRESGLPEHELREARETGRRDDERWHVRKGGERFWALGIVTPMHDSEGRHIGYSKILRDMTERKRHEEELRAADRRKDEFLAVLAHELRNPLAPLRTALEVMRGGGADIEAERSLAVRQVRHMARLIDDLMDIARISRGKVELRKEPLELCEMVRRAAESARTAIEERGHTLTVSLPDEPIVLEGDPTRLEQVIWNLLNNAGKYTEPGGQIDVSVGRDGEKAVLRVQDTGIGIEPGMLDRIFDPFTQARDRHGRHREGLGLGLNLVRSLVELHGGTIEAHSEGLGAGSEFVVRLPALRAGKGRTGPATGPPPEAQGPPPRRRILIVDDNVDSAVVMGKMLSRFHGQEVEVAHDGHAALEVARSFGPEVVLLDIGLPGMDGFEVARRLRGDLGLGRTVLVALTGWGQAEDRRRSQEAGFDHHLVKPVEPEDIVRLLAGLRPTPA